MLPRPVTVPVEMLMLLVADEGLGELHVTLAPTAVWRPKDARREARIRARQEVDRLGWLDRRGRLDAEVTATLAVVCCPAVEFYGWINQGDRTTAVLAGAIGREAVLAVRDGTAVTLSQVLPEANLAGVLVAQTPEIRPGQGRPVTVAQSELTVAPDAGMGRPAAVAVRQVQRIASLPVLGGGELYVAMRDGVGRRRKVEQPLRYADTNYGRFLNVTTRTSNGETHILVAPATKHDLVAKLHELRRELTW